MGLAAAARETVGKTLAQPHATAEAHGMRHGGWLILAAAMVLLVLLAMGRCTSVAQETNLSALAPYPTWTPRPTSTPRVYASWTLAPTATRRGATSTPSATWAATPTRALAPSRTPTYDGMPPETPQPCNAPWMFSVQERLRIQGAATYWGAQPYEIDLLPYDDALVGIGWFQEDLGAVETEAFAVEGDEHGEVIRVRGFSLGIVAVMEAPGLDNTCQHWAILRWSGEPRE
jgi:hypothetical protein